MDWFWSDPHLGHENIIKHVRRPFDTVEQMNRVIIERYNSRVKRGDRCFNLGDVFFHMTVPEMLLMREKLNGEQCLIEGNHDKKAACRIPQAWTWIKQLYVLNISQPFQQRIVLCHYAMRTWSASHRGSWHLYGHSHGQLPDDPTSLSFDVGVDCWDFYPISLQQVIDKMQKKIAAKAAKCYWSCGHVHKDYVEAMTCMEQQHAR